MAGFVGVAFKFLVYGAEDLFDAWNFPEYAKHKTGSRDLGRIPVVDVVNPCRLIGMVHRADIIRAYTRGLRDRQPQEDQLERLRLERAVSTRLLELDLGEGDAAVERKLEELRIPRDCLIISIRRGSRVVVPRGGTKFSAGDHVVALAASGKEEILRKCLQ